MTTSLGRLTARLGDPSEVIPTDLINRINENIKPLEELTESEIEIRTMYIVSDEINSFGGRFSVDEHAHLAQLLIDSPVLVGHRKDHLPIARTFFAEMIEHNGQPWVKSYFYWLKSAENSEQLCKNIDGGIYKECSIAFTFSLPECSICGRDIRNCSHEPFVEYEQQGKRISCHFNYKQIEKVLESSLVYRGANPGTSIGKVEHINQKLHSPDLLEPDRKYLVTPRYEGLDITLSLSGNGYSLKSADGLTFEIPFKKVTKTTEGKNSYKLIGRLVGYRGRERCNQKQLIKYLKKEETRVSRLVMHLYPGQTVCKKENSKANNLLEIKGIPYRLTTKVDLRKKSREITTRIGVDVRELNPTDDLTSSGESRSLVYHPEAIQIKKKDHYRLIINNKNESGSLTINHDGRKISFLLGAISLKGLKDGPCFPTNEILSNLTSSDDMADDKNRLVCCQGDLKLFTKQAGGLFFEGEGLLSGKFQLRPVRHHNRDSYLFYMINGSKHKQHQFSSESEMMLS